MKYFELKRFRTQDLRPGDIIFTFLGFHKFVCGFVFASYETSNYKGTSGPVWIVDYHSQELGKQRIISDVGAELSHSTSGVIRNGKIILWPTRPEITKLVKETFV